jgi:hypothetical protein
MRNFIQICFIFLLFGQIQGCNWLVDPLLEKKPFNNQPCKGANCVKISGKITSGENSLLPVVNATIELVSWRERSALFTNKSKIARFNTDAEGNYQISFTPSEEDLVFQSFSLIVSKYGYFSTANEFYLFSNRDTTFTQFLHLPQNQVLNLTLNGYEQAKTDEKLIVNISFKTYDEIGSQIASTFSDENGQVNFEIAKQAKQKLSYKVAANQYAYIYYQKIKAGQIIEKKDSVFCSANQPALYTIDW